MPNWSLSNFKNDNVVVKFVLVRSISVSFAIRVNLLHPKSFLFPIGLFLPLWCLSTLANYYLRVFFPINGNFQRTLKTTQNIVTYLLLQIDSILPANHRARSFQLLV